eukprot:NODE_7036_length_1615_cov_3.370296.p1 GENE.NODE_7036_length_1615_cov_3.370296~~NODE_7036_length_1615_cov_3.370296.p1  ORF type:complete len:322 (-),score=74.04 NODE_7036_length_1615_cov_3.370296:539-1504(-)
MAARCNRADSPLAKEEDNGARAWGHLPCEGSLLALQHAETGFLITLHPRSNGWTNVMTATGIRYLVWSSGDAMEETPELTRMHEPSNMLEEAGAADRRLLRIGRLVCGPWSVDADRRRQIRVAHGDMGSVYILGAQTLKFHPDRTTILNRDVEQLFEEALGTCVLTLMRAEHDISCISIAGNEVARLSGLRVQHSVAAARNWIAQQLAVSPRKLRLVLSDGQLVDDRLSLVRQVLPLEFVVSASTCPRKQAVAATAAMQGLTRLRLVGVGNAVPKAVLMAACLEELCTGTIGRVMTSEAPDHSSRRLPRPCITIDIVAVPA